MGATVAHSPAARRPTPGYLPAPQIAEVTAPAPTVPGLGPQAPRQPSSPPPRAAEPTVQTRAPANANRTLPPRPSEPTPAQRVPRAARASRRPSSAPPAQSRGMLIGLVAVGALAIAAIVLTLARPNTGASPQPPIRVVTLPSDPEPAPATGPVVQQPAAAVEPPPQPPATEPVKRTRAKRGPDAQSLTAAVRKQQSKLEACFKQHSVSLEGQPMTQLEFDLAASGELTRVMLTPRALAGTALGECLLAVGRGTTFPPQPHAVSFAIPLTARRGQ